MADPWKRKEVIGTLLDRVEFSGFAEPVAIYAINSGGGETVYVGSTSQPIKSRIRAHVSDAKNGSELPVHAWMRAQGFSFTVRLLETTTEPKRSRMEKKWVAELGGGLLNMTDGGPGMSGHKFARTEHAERIAASIRTGAQFRCEECAAPFWRKRRDILKGHVRFCSRACYHTWQRGRPKKRRAAA